MLGLLVDTCVWLDVAKDPRQENTLSVLEELIRLGESSLIVPRALRAELGEEVRHRTNCYLNNHLDQDHRGIKQRTRPMRGFKSVASTKRFCRVHDEARNFLRPGSRRNELVSLAQRRLLYTAGTHVLLTSLAAA